MFFQLYHWELKSLTKNKQLHLYHLTDLSLTIVIPPPLFVCPLILFSMNLSFTLNNLALAARDAIEHDCVKVAKLDAIFISIIQMKSLE